MGVGEQQALQDEQDLDAARFLVHALCLKALAVQGQAGKASEVWSTKIALLWVAHKWATGPALLYQVDSSFVRMLFLI